VRGHPRQLRRETTDIPPRALSCWDFGTRDRVNHRRTHVARNRLAYHVSAGQIEQLTVEGHATMQKVYLGMQSALTVEPGLDTNAFRERLAFGTADTPSATAAAGHPVLTAVDGGRLCARLTSSCVSPPLVAVAAVLGRLGTGRDVVLGGVSECR
jgi:hypothetical protein